MISLIVALFLLSFIQSSTLPGDWILIVLISRAFLRQDKYNYYLAFFFGLLNGFLLSEPLGFLALIYLLAIKITHTFKQFAPLSHWLLIVPLCLLLLLVEGLLRLIIFNMSLHFINIALESLMVLPIFLITRFWEERFVPKKEIRLKIGGK